ncbi:MAG: hypothetical protein KJ950_12350 [Proteobacteria bacterium]|nr:hypothetical protein [Pseudomonadota bacterium]MBU1687604.1 hypothetical protein [Pseudomonadota bacterium]
MKKRIVLTLALLLIAQPAMADENPAPPTGMSPPQPGYGAQMNPSPTMPNNLPPNQMAPWMSRGPGVGGPGFQGNMNPGYSAMGGGAPGGAAPGFGWSPQQQSPTGQGYFYNGPGVMMGQGMLQYGMGPGMIRGIGVMGYISTEAFQKFFDETKDLRRELNTLMFDYSEMLRDPKADSKERVNIENKIMGLRQQVYDKAPRYQWPFQ